MMIWFYRVLVAGVITGALAFMVFLAAVGATIIIMDLTGVVDVIIR